MTTIVGVEHDWGCEIVADGLTVCGLNNDRQYSGPGMEKVIERGQFLLAAAGLGIYTEPFMSFHPPRARQDSGIEFIREHFVPEFRAHLKETSNLELDNQDDVDKFEGMVALNGRLYVITDDATVLVGQDGFYGIGGGSNFAMGALAAGATAQEAVEIACRFHMLTGPPILRLEQRV